MYLEVYETILEKYRKSSIKEHEGAKLENGFTE